MNEECFTLCGVTLLCWASNINTVSISIPRQSLFTESVGAGGREKGERREGGGREERDGIEERGGGKGWRGSAEVEKKH